MLKLLLVQELRVVEEGNIGFVKVSTIIEYLSRQMKVFSVGLVLSPDSLYPLEAVLPRTA